MLVTAVKPKQPAPLAASQTYRELGSAGIRKLMDKPIAERLMVWHTIATEREDSRSARLCVYRYHLEIARNEKNPDYAEEHYTIATQLAGQIWFDGASESHSDSLYFSDFARYQKTSREFYEFCMRNDDFARARYLADKYGLGIDSVRKAFVQSFGMLEFLKALHAANPMSLRLIDLTFESKIVKVNMHVRELSKIDDADPLRFFLDIKEKELLTVAPKYRLDAKQVAQIRAEASKCVSSFCLKYAPEYFDAVVKSAQ